MVPPPPPAAAAAATPPHLSARPCPPNPREQQRVLHSIYQAIDTHNYAKVLKLTSSSSSSSSSSSPSTSTSSDRWDIVRALRIHALERCGKVREALILLWEVVAGDVVVAAVGAAATADVSNYSQQQRLIWSELYQRIQALTSVEDVIQHEGHGSSSNNRSGVVGSSHHNHHRSLGDIQLLDAVRRLDARSFAPIVNPYTSSISNDINTNESATTTTATTNKSSSGKISKGGSASGKSTTATTAKKSSSYSSTDYSINYYYPPVTDETVLQTLSVTLRNCELYDTMSEMYHQATTALSSSSSSASLARKNEEVEEEEEENYRNVLEEGVCVHFKAVCDCTSLDIDNNGSGGCNNRRSSTDEGNGKEPINDDEWGRITVLQSQLPRLQSVLNMTKYYERMQTSECCVTDGSLHILLII
jgi:hypothetical protein